MKKNEIKKIKWRIRRAFSACPRCGQEYSYIEFRRTKHNIYVYFVHDKEVKGKRKVKKCYSGALTQYIYVQRFQSEGIKNLRGIHDPTRFFDYYVQLTKYFSEILAYQSSSLNIEQLRKLRKCLEEMLYLTDMALSQTK